MSSKKFALIVSARPSCERKFTRHTSVRSNRINNYSFAWIQRSWMFGDSYFSFDRSFSLPIQRKNKEYQSIVSLKCFVKCTVEFRYFSSKSVCNQTRDKQIGLPLRGCPILLITRLRYRLNWTPLSPITIINIQRYCTVFVQQKTCLPYWSAHPSGIVTHSLLH